MFLSSFDAAFRNSYLTADNQNRTAYIKHLFGEVLDDTTLQAVAGGGSVTPQIVMATVPREAFFDYFRQDVLGQFSYRGGLPDQAFSRADAIDSWDRFVRWLLVPYDQSDTFKSISPRVQPLSTMFEDRSGTFTTFFGEADSAWGGSYGTYWQEIGLSETTRAKMESTMEDAAARGLPANQAARMLRDDLSGEFGLYRSTLIARTELTAGRNFAKYGVWQESGTVEEKRWSSAFDPRTRPWHADADGQVVGLAESFTVGGAQMEYPGDFAGGARNTCNCFLDGQIPVFTDSGWKKIMDIRPGDNVLTHKNRFRKVLRLAEPLTHRGLAIRIRVAAYNTGGKSIKTVLVTPDHRFLTADGWKVARDFVVGDGIMMAGLPCAACGEPAPIYRNNGYCSDRCQRSASAKVQWESDAHRELISHKTSAQLRREYANGTRDPHAITVTARKAAFAKYGPGGYLGSNQDEVHAKAMEAIREKYGSHIEFLKRFAFPALGKTAKKGTAIEEAMAKFLDKNGRRYIRQFPVGRRRPDFYLPDEKLFVECDGVFWHQDKDAERRRDIEILRQYPDHRIAHVTYGAGNNGQPVWDFRDLKMLNHEGQFCNFTVEVVEVEHISLGKGKRTWDFAVEDDESYVAKGVVSHNCRCTMVPLRKTIEEADAGVYDVAEGFGDALGVGLENAQDEIEHWSDVLGENDNFDEVEETKDRIAETLLGRVADNPDWIDFLKTEMAEQFAASGAKIIGADAAFDEQAVVGMIHQWAVSSADTDELAIALQACAREEFAAEIHGVPLTSHFTLDIDKVFDVVKGQGADLGIRRFLREMYDETQEWLTKQGVDEYVIMYRGQHWGDLPESTAFKFALSETQTAYAGESGGLQLQPLSSFSTSLDTAKQFAAADDYHIVTAARVPKSRIIGTCQTGFGCKRETEMIVLGGTDDSRGLSWQRGLAGTPPPSTSTLKRELLGE